MILVTLGTQDKKFPRLIKAVEKQIELGNIKDEVIVQAGSTKYKSDKMKILDYVSTRKFHQLINEADLVITHAGVGNILMGLEKHKKMIVAARLKQYEEHVNDHQTQILGSFDEKGYIIPLYDFDKLDEAIKKAKNFEPNEFESNNKNFVKSLKEEIEDLL